MSKEFIEELRNHAAARTGYTAELIGKAADAIEPQAATIARYEVTAENCDLLRGQAEEQAQEIEQRERDAKNDAIAYKAVLERQNEMRAELTDLKSQPSGVVLPERLRKVLAFLDGSGELDGYSFGEDWEKSGQFWWRKELRDAIDEVARLNQPVSPGDDRVAVACCAVCGSDRSALSANHGEQVREWVPVNERLPETKAGTNADFVVAIRRAHNGKTYVVPAGFLNRFELYSEDEAADDEGRIYVTGWYREMADDEYDTSWHKMETEGDLITHWQELPAAPSAGSQKEQGE